jgi:hypothetical protein
MRHIHGGKRVVANNLDRPTGGRSGKSPPRQKRG